MVKCLSHGLRGFNGAAELRLATLTVTMLISSCWQLSSDVKLRRIFDICKRWANSGSHKFVKENMVRYMRPHGRFAHCSCKNAVRQPPVLASCIEIYYFGVGGHDFSKTNAPVLLKFCALPSDKIDSWLNEGFFFFDYNLFYKPIHGLIFTENRTVLHTTLPKIQILILLKILHSIPSYTHLLTENIRFFDFG